MFCPSCHTKNQFYNNYCYYCGHKLKETDNLQRENPETQPELRNDGLYKDDSDLNSETIYEAREDWNEEHNLADDISADDESEELPQLTSDINNNDDDFFEQYNHFKENDLFSDSSTFDFDLTTQIPLRRYQKNKTSSIPMRFLKSLLTILTLIVVGVAIFTLVHHMGRQTNQNTNVSKSIAVSWSVEETTKDDEKAYRVVFNTVNGKEVNFLGQSAIVENGRAEFIVTERQLYSYFPILNEDGLYEVILDATIISPSLPDSTERVSIVLTPPYHYAPFTLLQPSSWETEFQGNSSKVAFKIEPGSTVIINEQDFSDLVSEDGRFEKEFKLPPQQDEMILDIRVSCDGYLDNIQQLILRKKELDVPLTINETSPIFSTELWIKVSGITHPDAVIETDQEIFEQPNIDRETGAFEVYVKAERPGYTLCTLTAKVEDKESSVEVVLERKTTVDTYTSTAWKPDFNQLQQDEQLNNGRHFVFTGYIKDIIETGDKNVFTVNLTEESEQLFYVEYWGSFEFSMGDRIRVFGNRWGNKNGIPRFLAKYIYE